MREVEFQRTVIDPYLQDPDVTVYQGDALETLRLLPDESVQMCVTSPPFFGLRDYGTGTWEGGDPGCDHLGPPVRTQAGFNERWSGKEYSSDKQGEARHPFKDICGKCGAHRVDQQIGLESSPDEWAASLVQVFREVRRVLRKDGTLWLEIGDSYASSPAKGGSGPNGKNEERWGYDRSNRTLEGLKPKDLIGAPWLLAFALRKDGWYLRSEIIWAKPNPMPESVTDRPTTSHSRIFLLTRSPRYFYDADAIREPAGENTHSRGNGSTPKGEAKTDGNHADGFYESTRAVLTNRNKRTVWTIPTEPLPYDHYAAFPQKLVEPCILAGTSEKGCCPECGAPWVREIERGELIREDTARFTANTWNGDARKGDHTTNSRGVGSLPPNHHYENRTTGWAPGCTHNLDPVPCTVLDPFHGSGTTSLVARKHGRKAIGIELNPAYNRIAAERLQQLSLLA